MASVDLRSVRTSNPDPVAAAEDICQQLGGVEPKLLFMFAARAFDHAALNRAIRERLPRTRFLGATAARQIDGHGMHRGTIVAAAISGQLEVGFGLGRRVMIEPFKAGATAMIDACEDLGVRPHDLTKRHVGIVIDDGQRHHKEEFLIGMMDPNPTVVMVGGGASDENAVDLDAPSSCLHVDGRVVSDGAIVALIETDARWAAMRTHGYEPTGRTLRITKVDGSGMRVPTIDGRPAAKRYAELIGCPVDELPFGTPSGFAQWATALKVGREYFMRSAAKPLPDGSIVFNNLLEDDTELEIMRAGDFAAATKRFFADEIPARIGTPTAALLFHCGARTWFCDARGEGAALAAAFTAPWAAGMNTQFETYCGINLNATLNALVFGRS